MLKSKAKLKRSHAEYLRMPKKEYKVALNGKRVSVTLYEWQWEMSHDIADELELDHHDWLMRKLKEVQEETDDDQQRTSTEIVTYAITRMISGDE